MSLYYYLNYGNKVETLTDFTQKMHSNLKHVDLWIEFEYL